MQTVLERAQRETLARQLRNPLGHAYHPVYTIDIANFNAHYMFSYEKK